MAIAGVFDIGMKWPTAQTSASTLNSKPSSTKVCIRIPAETPPVLPKTTVMVSPSLRYPPETPMLSDFQRGRAETPRRAYSTLRVASLPVVAVT